MRILLLCATNRGARFLRHLQALAPNDELVVVSFREDPWEPKFFEEIRLFTQEYDIEFYETKNVANAQMAPLWEKPIDLILVVSWRYLLPMSHVNQARIAAVVFHDSLLPAYRGFSPTVWAMINGEDHTGVSVLHLAAEVDSGDIIDQVRIPIRPDETIADVMDRVTQAYLVLLEDNFDRFRIGQIPRVPQDHSLATFTCKRVPDDNLIDWNQSSRAIFNLIRAVSQPYPGAYTFYRGTKMVIWSATFPPVTRLYVGSIPGRVISRMPGKGVEVITGDGVLLIKTVQLGDGPPLCAADAVKSITDRLGERLRF